MASILKGPYREAKESARLSGRHVGVAKREEDEEVLCLDL